MGNFSYQKSFDVRRKIEPARNYLWRVELPDLSAPLPTPMKSASFDRAKEMVDGKIGVYDSLALNSRVTEVTTPYWSIETNKVIDGATFWYTATHNDISNVSVVIDEDEYGSTLQYFDDWKSLIINPNGTYNPPAFWKRTIKVYRLNLMKLDFQVLNYTGYFPSEVNQVSSNYEADGALQYTVSFTGDALHSETVNLDDYMNENDKMVAALLASSPKNDITDYSVSASQLLELGLAVANEVGIT